MQYFPDRFVKREISNLEVMCIFSEDGCNWEGKFNEDYFHHKSICGFRSTASDLLMFTINASPTLSINGLSHELVGMQSWEQQCSLQPLGCSNEVFVDSDELTAQQSNNFVAEKLQVMEAMVMSSMQEEFKVRDKQISSLRSQVMRVEKQIRSKKAELEDRDFRLALIERSNHDGSMIWKLPQFSQCKADAENGKYTSVFSLPFYSGRYGYKMCLRLYIMGDGIGKGTHLSLFFVVMRGEFDNILQWPFTHKVTFKLINQAGGSDIVDTFQPDPLNCSFRKPKSDMNIASGCPQFITHTELERGGFIVDDTIFIKCTIDITTICHP